jgi:hypothetical protein
MKSPYVERSNKQNYKLAKKRFVKDTAMSADKKVDVLITGPSYDPGVILSFRYIGARIKFKVEHLMIFRVEDIKRFQTADSARLNFSPDVELKKKGEKITFRCTRPGNELKIKLLACACDELLDDLIERMKKRNFPEEPPFVDVEADYAYFTVMDYGRPGMGHYYQGRKALPVKLVGLNSSHVSKLTKMLAGEDVTLIAPDELEYSNTEMSPIIHSGTQLRTEGGYLLHGPLNYSAGRQRAERYELDSCKQFLSELIAHLKPH